ncbi:MAG: Ig-like domain-containing protein [Acidimicrobiia bacterium]
MSQPGSTTLNLVRRTTLIAIAIAIIVGFGAGAYLLVPWKGDSADAASGAPKLRPTGNGRFALVAFPQAGATGIPADSMIRVDAKNGRIKRLTVKGPDGTEVRGYLDAAGTWWLAKTRLALGTPYQVTAHVIPNRGKARTEHWTFTTQSPTGDLGARVVPGDNEVVGVGQPISVRFTQPVANKAAVEARLNVTTSVPVDGSWHWMSDREVHWRPFNYWPANTDVVFDADLTGVDAGNGVIGNVHRTAHFRIGASHVSIANATTHILTVYENGAVVKTFPMSAGRDKYPTMSGKHLVLGKQQDVIMDSRTNGIPLDSPDGYYEHVFWDVAISSSGEYVHAAPWSVSNQGRSNVSHGCINLSVPDATWFFTWSQRGDIVEVTGTPRPPNDDIAMVDWKVPNDQWAQGSALYDPIPPAQAPHRS